MMLGFPDIPGETTPSPHPTVPLGRAVHNVLAAMLQVSSGRLHLFITVYLKVRLVLHLPLSLSSSRSRRSI